MKKRGLLLAMAATLAVAGTCSRVQGQQPSAQPQAGGGAARPPAVDGQGQVFGRGRGGLPWAWNDADGDGVCDVTGLPVGQIWRNGRGTGRGRLAARSGRMGAAEPAGAVGPGRRAGIRGGGKRWLLGN